MNIYATPIDSRGYDELGTEAHYIEKNTYKTVRNFLRYRDLVGNWPNKVFALYTFGDFSGIHTLIGYVYDYTTDGHTLAQLHLQNHRDAQLPENIGHGYLPD